MTARQDKVREALDWLKSPQAKWSMAAMNIRAAAVAEVDEWEARLSSTKTHVRVLKRRAEKAEAERDKLKEALERISDGIYNNPREDAEKIARVALGKGT